MQWQRSGSRHRRSRRCEKCGSRASISIKFQTWRDLFWCFECKEAFSHSPGLVHGVIAMIPWCRTFCTTLLMMRGSPGLNACSCWVFKDPKLSDHGAKSMRADGENITRLNYVPCHGYCIDGNIYQEYCSVELCASATVVALMVSLSRTNHIIPRLLLTLFLRLHWVTLDTLG